MSQNDYSIKELIQMEACTNCCLCADVCPAVAATDDGQLSGVYRLLELRKIMRSRSGFLRRFFGRKAPSREQLKQFSETVYRCTLCGRCQQTCPSGIMLRDLWLSLRQDLVHTEAYPQKVNMIRENVTKSHNVFDEDNEERGDWVEDLRNPPDHGYVKDKAEGVYFTGCVAAYFKKVAISGDFFCFPQDTVSRLEKAIEGSPTKEILKVVAVFYQTGQFEWPGVEIDDWIQLFRI
jgi:heterodisulfide reductase subunit D